MFVIQCGNYVASSNVKNFFVSFYLNYDFIIRCNSEVKTNFHIQICHFFQQFGDQLYMKIKLLLKKIFGCFSNNQFQNCFVFFECFRTQTCLKRVYLAWCMASELSMELSSVKNWCFFRFFIHETFFRVTTPKRIFFILYTQF